MYLYQNTINTFNVCGLFNLEDQHWMDINLLASLLSICHRYVYMALHVHQLLCFPKIQMNDGLVICYRGGGGGLAMCRGKDPVFFYLARTKDHPFFELARTKDPPSGCAHTWDPFFSLPEHTPPVDHFDK